MLNIRIIHYVTLLCVTPTLGICDTLHSSLRWDGRQPTEIKSIARSSFINGDMYIVAQQGTCERISGSVSWTHVGRDLFGWDSYVYPVTKSFQVARGGGVLASDNNYKTGTGHRFAIQSVSIIINEAQGCQSQPERLEIHFNGDNVTQNTGLFEIQTLRPYSVEYQPLMTFEANSNENRNISLGRFVPNKPLEGYKYRLKLNDDSDAICRTLLLGGQWPITTAGDVYEGDMELTINGYKQQAGEHGCSLTLSIDEL